MGLRINQNIEALNAYRNLGITSGQQSKSLEKLSSGFRINRAADDAAASLAELRHYRRFVFREGAKEVAREVARRCTGETNLGLGAFAKAAGSDSFSMLASPLGPLPSGRGLILVGDLDLAPRVRGNSPARTVARWLTVGVDDGRKLL